MLSSIVLASLALFAPSLVSSASLSFRRSKTAPRGYNLISAAAADETLVIRLALKQSNQAAIEKAVYDVSTPGSDKYGRYLSKDEITEFATPSPESLAAVKQWMSSNDLTYSDTSPFGDMITFSISVRKANKLFNADYSTFSNEKANTTVTRTLSYKLPDDLADHLPLECNPTTGPQPEKISRKAYRDLDSRDANTLPSACDNPNVACISALYEIPSAPATHKSNTIWVSGFQDDFANKADLAKFLQINRPDIPSTTSFDVVTINGGLNNQLPIGAGFTSGISMQYTAALATGVPITFMSVGTDNPDLLQSFIDQANYLVALDEPPHTVIWAWNLVEGSISVPQAKKLCNIYAQLSARGVSLIHMGGSGAFPATCPFVTAVGNTDIDNDSEIAGWLSGNIGFSHIFPQPHYQSSTIKAYISTGDGSCNGLCNATNRATPDISALQDGNYVLRGLDLDTVGFQAISVATIGSIVALLNDELIGAGKPTLGFLNPWIYSNPSMFKDITTANYSPFGCIMGYNCTQAGWDPATGLGTPLYSAMRKAAGL